MSNPETVATVLRDRPDGFRRTDALQRDRARELGFDGLFSANGEAWKRQRPMVLRGLDPTHIKAFLPTLVKVTQRFERRWHRAAKAGEPIDLQADLMRYTVDVTAGLAFGTDINTIESEDEVIQQHLDKLLPGAVQARSVAAAATGAASSCPTTARSNGTSRRCARRAWLHRRARGSGSTRSRNCASIPRNLIEAMLAAARPSPARLDRRGRVAATC